MCKCQVFDKDDIILSGVVEMSNSNGFAGESKNSARKWSMNCESYMTASAVLSKWKQIVGPKLIPTNY